jgi:HK97 family phage major capsid protein
VNTAAEGDEFSRHGLEELQDERAKRKERLNEIDAEHAGKRFSAETKEEWNRLNTEIDDIDESIRELHVRTERLKAIADQPENVERIDVQFTKPVENIYDLSNIRRDFGDPSVEGNELRERARRVIDDAKFPSSRAMRTTREASQEYVSALVEEKDTEDGLLSRRIVLTGSPAYKRAVGKYVFGNSLSTDESRLLSQSQMLERALSLTGSAGGFAVPFELDPTIIPTSNLAVNPFRAIARVEQITVDEWRGVSSGGVTVAYAAEATAASDNAPTLAQPTISTEKAQAFIPFSIEIGMDWPSLQAEMGRLLQDGKDELEATKFALGSGTNEPQGVITGATNITTASGTASFAYADLDTLEAALPPRFRPMASMVMNRAIAQKVRHFDTAGGAAVWNQGVQLQQGLQNQVPTPGSYGVTVLGYPAYESSAMDAVLTTGSEIVIMGDFRYYVIVDRIGLNIEVIPHLFDVTNNRPTGQRGLYAWFRNGAGVTSAAAFRVLRTG